MAYVKKVWTNAVDVLDKINMDHLETQYDEGVTDLTAHKTNSGAPGVHRWTTDKFLNGAGAGADPTEVDPTILNIILDVSDNLRNSNDAEKTTDSVPYVKVKEIALDTGLNNITGNIRIKFGIANSEDGYNAFGKIYRNGVAIGTEQSTVGQGVVVKSEDFNGIDWSASDLIQIYAHSYNGSDDAEITDFRLYWDSMPKVSTTNQDP